MFRTVLLSIIRSFSLYTQQWYMSYSLRAGSGRNCSSVLILLASCQQTCMTYTIAVCTVKNSCWWTENCPKHAEFYSKNKFEKLVHLVGFIIRLYHDARSPERQIRLCIYERHFIHLLPTQIALQVSRSRIANFSPSISLTTDNNK